jgi:hypothetical protein
MAAKVEDRAREYRAIADKLRRVAQQAQDAAVQAELQWLAVSYERLAVQIEQGEECPRIAEGARSPEIPKSPAKSR